MSGLPAKDVDEVLVRQAVEVSLDQAKKQGASSAEAGASLDSGLSVTVRKGEVETLEHHLGQSLGITVYQGQRKGSASTSDLSSQAITDAVAAALSIARHTSEDDCAGLADADLMATDFPDLDLYHPWDISTEGMIELTQACEAAAFAEDKRISNSEGASANSFAGVAAYGNSHGFLATKQRTRHSISCTSIAEDENGMQRDYYYSTSRLPEQLEAVEFIGKEAARRTVGRLSGRKLTTRRTPVLFAAEISRGLLSSFIKAISGSALYRKSSFLLDCIDQPVFSDFVHIHESPLIPQALGSAAFDSEGVATRERDLISHGILQSYVLGSYSARKLGLQTTGNAGGVHNLMIDSGDKDFAALLKGMDTGLYITELIGHGINLVTGDYSRGASGFWVENGEIQFPVEEVTVAGNLRQMFKQLLAVGTDVDQRGNYQTGSWLIEEMMVGGE